MNRLTHQEKRTLVLLSAGKSYDYIRGELGVRLGDIHMITYSLRKKTGIKDTQDQAECAAALEQWRSGLKVYATSTQKRIPTPMEIRVMYAHAIAEKGYEQIRLEHGWMHVQSVHNHLSMGCLHAGIRHCHRSLRKQEIKKWLLANRELLEIPTMDDPMF